MLMSGSQRRFSKIFVVIDPTRFVQTAYLRAESIAQRNGARLVVYCCIADGAGGNLNESTTERVDVARKAIERLVSTSGLDDVEVVVEWNDDWRRALVDAAVHSKCDLIVKQASRHSLVGRVFSATADWMLLRAAIQPVLLVSERRIQEKRRVLAALKLKPDDAGQEALNQKIVDLSHYLSNAVGFEMHAATVFKGEEVYFDRQRFADFCGLARNRVHAVGGSPHVAIAKAAEDVGADTIVIGNPENSETAQRLIDHAVADMLILPPSD
jgi:nucleotide-binding universal stress UspA family protein